MAISGKLAAISGETAAIRGNQQTDRMDARLCGALYTSPRTERIPQDSARARTTSQGPGCNWAPVAATRRKIGPTSNEKLLRQNPVHDIGGPLAQLVVRGIIAQQPAW